MSARRASFKQADATRALKGAVAAGLRPTGFRIDPSGAIEVQFEGQARSAAINSFDDILGR